MRKNRVERQWACRSAAVQWLYSKKAIGSAARGKTWGEFFLDDVSMWAGYYFESDDVEEAALWLYQRGFIDGITTGESDWPVRAYLTRKGEDCGEAGGDVRTYLAAMRDQ